MSENLRVVILFGGTSSEHDISLRSATNVLAELAGCGYDLHLIGITREGQWLNYTGNVADVCEGDAWASHDVCPVVVVPGGGLCRHEADGSLTRLDLDVALPVLHGQGGEDGITQALLESAGVPYVGCGVLSSAVCMDKDVSHRLAAASGIRVPKCEVLYRSSTQADVDAAVAACGGYPVFVKPTRGGSSYGVSKVSDASELAAALDLAFSLDPQVSVEEAIVGTEVGCAITGDAAGELEMGVVDETVVTDGGFFHIHQDQTAGASASSMNSSLRCPAQISDEQMALVRKTGFAVYRALCCSGFARVDLFVTPAGEVVLNEVNTIPGLTRYSRFPEMMKASGKKLADVLEGLVEAAASQAR